jgi:catechol 2,3-dioxygenase-like lactoylglutathione lyase family enzyme
MGGAPTSVGLMLTITHSSIFVLDQDEALEFYVGKLGLAVETDADLGFMRWLTVRAPGNEDREVLLELPGPPAHDEATAAQVRELVTKGAMGFVGLRTDDIHRTYAELKARGVELDEEPTEHFYGSDFGLRDPFGNHIRIVQPAEGPIEVPAPSEFAQPGD